MNKMMMDLEVRAERFGVFVVLGGGREVRGSFAGLSVGLSIGRRG